MASELAKINDDEPDERSPGEKKDEEILNEARTRFKRAYDFESDFRPQYIEDVKFAAGDSDNHWQWPSEVYNARVSDTSKRPTLTVNIVQGNVFQITNDFRQNMPSVAIKPTGDESTFESAQIYESLMRNVEYTSNARSIYMDAYQSSVEGGIGYCRCVTRFDDEDSWDQSFFIDPVRSHLGVLLDCDIKQKDGSDALWGFIWDQLPKKEFERQYPKVELTTQTSPLDIADDWIGEDSVRIAEYYRILQEEDQLIHFQEEGGQPVQFKMSEMPPVVKQALKAAEERGAEIRRRKIWNRKLQWFKIAGNQIVARVEKLPGSGKYIPIIRFLGRERMIEGRLDRKGIVRPLKDTQRMLNYYAPLALDTKIPTPSGWTTMGEVKPGDTVFDEAGKPCAVVGMSPVYTDRKCWNVKFNDGTSIVADDGHLWDVEESKRLGGGSDNWVTKTVTTSELWAKRHFIKSAPALDIPDTALVADPYVLGLWLGDGASEGSNISSGMADIEDTWKNVEAAGYTPNPIRKYEYAGCGVFSVGGLRAQLVELGLLFNKHIPPAYLRSSREQRLALLQGLMDSDGCFRPPVYQCIFVNVNPLLVTGIWELLRSLGIKAVIKNYKGITSKFPNGKVYTTQPTYRVTFTADPDVPVFRLERKHSLQTKARKVQWRRTKRVGIVSVTEIASVPVKCIKVDTETHLFLAGEGMVPTHNSTDAEFNALQPKSPYIGYAESFEGNEATWNKLNTANPAWLPANMGDDPEHPIPLPQRNNGPTDAPAYANGMMRAVQHMGLISGINDAKQGNQSNERSGLAIQARARGAENANYDFAENAAMAVQYIGRIFIDWAPDVYDTERTIKAMGRDGQQTDITIKPELQQAMQKELVDKVEKVLFDPSVGKYEVQSNVGPSFATQREQAWESFVGIITKAPELMAKMGDLGFRSSDAPLSDKIAERLHRDIEHNAPWLLEDGQPPAIVQQLTQANQQLTGVNAQLLDQLGTMQKKLDDQQVDLGVKVFDSGTKRYDAISKRTTAVSNAQPELDRTGDDPALEKAIRKTLIDLLMPTPEPEPINPPDVQMQ